jgi:phage terminase large subunit
MLMTDNYRDSYFNKSSLKYTFSNNSYIEFFSVDQPDKLRGARRDILFINECNNIDFESYQQLSVRTKKFIYLDYNPTNEFWVHTELKNDIDSDFVVLTYKDNEALDPAIVREIEKAREKAQTSSYWANWWNVYGLGQLGSLEGVVFPNWEQIDTIPQEAKFLGCGLDFGYSNDPTAMIGIYEYNGKIIADEMIYSTSLLNSDIIRLMKQDKRLPIWADSAEPKSIEEIRRAGFNIKPVVKGADSINFGISVLQEKDLLVTKHSTNLIKELRNYSWDTDKTGKRLNRPIDDYNHAIDAMRYFAMMGLSIRKSRKVIIT